MADPAEVTPPIGTSPPTVKPKTEVIVYEDFWKPLPIKRLIFATTEFIVYLGADGHLGWQTMSSIDIALNALAPAEVGAVHNRSTEICAMPIEHLTDSQQENFRLMMGEGFARLFSLDPKNALQMMNAAGAYVSARNQEIARGWQLKGTAWIAAAFFILASIAWLARSALRPKLGELPFILLLGVCAGAVGALFSVLTRLGTNSLDPSAGERLHLLEGGARVVAGAIGAIFAVLAVHLSLILGMLKTFGHPALIFIALIAGASERLVPTIIKKTEDDAASPGKGNAPS
ncbi:MAG: hypothetical protein DME97_17695 [Verrucomicrobia bacterium]|nr:MAG: hypothetical protein DME97_17695 [Verrucomicrobiota bacterium]